MAFFKEIIQENSESNTEGAVQGISKEICEKIS